MPGLIDRVSAQLSTHLKPRSKLISALSGGVDSIVLLDVLDIIKRDLDFELSALHVNHQLNPRANEWTSFCRGVCSSREIPFEAVIIQVPREGNQEAAARALRYQVFSQQDAGFVVLAQHQDDQVETVLLRLLRGAGVNGLAGMREIRDQGAGVRDQDGALAPDPCSLAPRILRPLLKITRVEILSYASERKLKWIEDESNLDASFDRNFLRREILPAIEKRFPGCRETIARAADNLADTAELLDELARIDAKRCISDEAIDIAELKRLSPGRARNLLRFFLRGRGLLMPGRAWLEQALAQLLSSRQDSKARISLGAFELRPYRGDVHCVPRIRVPEDFCATWQGEDEIVLSELRGTLRFSRAVGKGISASRLAKASIRIRQGGERIRPDCKRPRRTLKNLLQEHRIPPWCRETLPLLFDGETLVWAPGIGIDCQYQAEADQIGVIPEWMNSHGERI